MQQKIFWLLLFASVVCHLFQRMLTLGQEIQVHIFNEKSKFGFGTWIQVRTHKIARIIASQGEQLLSKSAIGGALSKHSLKVYVPGDCGFTRSLDSGEVEHYIKVDEIKHFIKSQNMMFTQSIANGHLGEVSGTLVGLARGFTHVIRNGKYLTTTEALKPENLNHPTAAGKGLEPDLKFSKYEYGGFPTGEVGAGEGQTLSLFVEVKNFQYLISRGAVQAQKIQVKAAEKNKWHLLSEKKSCSTSVDGGHELIDKEVPASIVVVPEIAPEVDLYSFRLSNSFGDNIMIEIDNKSVLNLQVISQELSSSEKQ